MIVPGESDICTILKVVCAEIDDFKTMGMSFVEIVVVLEGKNSYKVLDYDLNAGKVKCENTAGEVEVICFDACGECNGCCDCDDDCVSCDCSDCDVSNDLDCTETEAVELLPKYPDLRNVNDKDFACTIKNANVPVTLDDVVTAFRKALVDGKYEVDRDCSSIEVCFRDMLPERLSDVDKGYICDAMLGKSWDNFDVKKIGETICETFGFLEYYKNSVCSDNNVHPTYVFFYEK